MILKHLQGRGIATGLLLGSILIFNGCKHTPAVKPLTEAPVPTVAFTVTPFEPSQTEKPEEPTEDPSPKYPGNTVTPVPTKKTEATLKPEPTMPPTKEPTETPEPTKKPEMEKEITPTKEPEPTKQPEVTVTPVITAEPTVLPEYESLLQSGYRKMEDFFSRREIFYPEQFDQVELKIEAPDFCYIYTCSGESGSTLTISYEEGKKTAEFISSLTKEIPEVTVFKEAGGDFSYTYGKNGQRVFGRVYDSGDEQKKARIRAEVSCSEDSELNKKALFFRELQ